MESVNSDHRGTTGPGRRAAIPTGSYTPAPEVEVNDSGGLMVRFTGEDGREKAFDLERIALPGWRTPLAGSLAARIGPAGRIRTRSSVQGVWGMLVNFTDYLAALPTPPSDPAQLRLSHMKSYHQTLKITPSNERSSWGRLRQVGAVLREPPIRELIDDEVFDYLSIRAAVIRSESGLSGYSDGELRRLLTRLREEAARVRDRIEQGQSLAEQFSREPREIAPEKRDMAQRLATIAETGVVPICGGSATTRLTQRKALAEQLYVVPRDLVPLTALFVAVAGRNLETIKELPATCRKLGGDAIEITLVKRRRGPNRWFETVAWEIGPPGKELHYPGGLFLMVQRLTHLSRRFSGANRLWAAWRNGHRDRISGTTAEHYDAFSGNLALPYYPADWSAEQEGLWADPAPGQPERARLQLNTMRLRKSIEVRRTRQMGGHLPSAARSNSYPVLFSSYLSGDTTARQWSEDVMAEALTNAEEAAWQAHQAMLERSGGHLRVISTEPAAERSNQEAGNGSRTAPGRQDTAFAACTDPEEHPATGKPCRTPSLLDCFHCGNCLITRDHLPRLLALLGALAQRRQQMSDADWWQRYGPVWVAIRRDILDGRHFTPAEIETAKHNQPHDALLDLVEEPWENTE